MAHIDLDVLTSFGNFSNGDSGLADFAFGCFNNTTSDDEFDSVPEDSSSSIIISMEQIWNLLNSRGLD